MQSRASPAIERGGSAPAEGARPVVEAHGALAALRAQGADRLDPIRFRYLEALARRVCVLQGEPRRVLDGKLTRLLAAAALQIDALRAERDQLLGALAQRHPLAEPLLRQRDVDSDVRALRRRLARHDGQSRSGLLGSLLTHIERQAQEPAQPGAEKNSVVAGSLAAPPATLKAVQRHQDVWSRLRVDRQLARSHAKAPENPGPLNSHLLVLRSLRRMQDIAPAYLAQFMSYAETLLWLDQAGPGQAPVSGKTVRPAPGRRKPVRGRGKSA